MWHGYGPKWAVFAFMFLEFSISKLGVSETTVYTLKTSNFNWNNHDDPSTFGAPYLFRKPLFVTRCGKTIDKPNNLRIHEPICELVSFS